MHDWLSANAAACWAAVIARAGQRELAVRSDADVAALNAAGRAGDGDLAAVGLEDPATRPAG